MKFIPITHDHQDVIHDIAYDYYGRRIATCSSDHSVKVFDLSENEQWTLSASWKVHSGSVWRVTWAHPEFGQILGTCSFDRTAIIWEEIVSETSSTTGQKSQKHWIKRCSLVDSRSNVTDIKFAPKHLGLIVATCSQDGNFRIYEAVDIMNLTQWSLQHEIEASKLRCSCLAWNPSPYHSPLLAVGSDDPNVGSTKINLFEYKENSRKWSKIGSVGAEIDPVYDVEFANNIGRSFHTLAVASKNVRIYQLKPFSKEPNDNSNTKFDITKVAQFEEHDGQVWRVSWNITGTVLASSGADSIVRLWKANYLNNWKCVTALKQSENGVEPVFAKIDA